jgi:hypothetical protein
MDLALHLEKVQKRKRRDSLDQANMKVFLWWEKKEQDLQCHLNIKMLIKKEKAEIYLALVNMIR